MEEYPPPPHHLSPQVFSEKKNQTTKIALAGKVRMEARKEERLILKNYV